MAYRSRSQALAKASPRGKKTKDVSVEQLEQSLVEVEKSWRQEAKQRADDEKRRKMELNQAKKMIGKEIRTAAGAVRKKEMEVKKMEQRIGQSDRKKDQLTSNKNRQVGVLDQKVGACEHQRNEFESVIQTKMSDLGEAKGRLAHARFAEEMLGKGMIVSLDGTRQGMPGSGMAIMDGDEPSFMDSPGRGLDFENARLTKENHELLTRLEMAENYIKEMEQKLGVSRGTPGSSALTPVRVDASGRQVSGVVRQATPLSNIHSQQITPSVLTTAGLTPYATGSVGSMLPIPSAGGYSQPLSSIPPELPSFSPPQTPIETARRSGQSPVKLQPGTPGWMGPVGNQSYAGVASRMPDSAGALASYGTPISQMMPTNPITGLPMPRSDSPHGPSVTMPSPVVATDRHGRVSHSLSNLAPSGNISTGAGAPPASARQMSIGGMASYGGSNGSYGVPSYGVPMSIQQPMGGVYSSGYPATPRISYSANGDSDIYQRDAGIVLEAVAQAPGYNQWNQSGLVLESVAQPGRGPVDRRGSMTDELFDVLDMNHDGVINRAEFRAGVKGHLIQNNMSQQPGQVV